MVKTKVLFACRECGASYPKWQGQCATCGEWNCLEEVKVSQKQRKSGGTSGAGFSGSATEITRLAEVKLESSPRILTRIQEFDRVLGGGLVPGSVVLIGGEPGAGKSTLLIQMASEIARDLGCVYVSGEESIQQIASRAIRLGISDREVQLATLTDVGQVLALVERTKPAVVVVDSIQVMHSDEIESVPGVSARSENAHPN